MSGLRVRREDSRRLAEAMTDPNPELGERGKLPGETEEETISRIFAEVRAEPPPRQNAGGPGCWRTEEPVAYPPDFSDLAGHPRPGAGVPDDPQVRIAEELLADPPTGMAEMGLNRMRVDVDENIPETDVLGVVAQEILDIGRTHGWDNFGKMVEQLKKEGL